MRKFLLLGVAAAALGGFASAAQAAPIITGTAVPPGAIAFGTVDLGTSASQGYQPGITGPITPSNALGETISFVAGGSSPHSGVYAGSSTDAKSPLGPSNASANYLVAEPGSGSVTVTFAGSRTAFNLLWGTVDSNTPTYNQLTFSGGGATTTINGADIASALGIAGDGTVNAAVQIAGLAPFTTVTATASSIGFEFLPGTSGTGTPVPEPGSLALLGTALLGLGFIGWSMKKRRAA